MNYIIEAQNGVTCSKNVIYEESIVILIYTIQQTAQPLMKLAKKKTEEAPCCCIFFMLIE